MAIRNVQIISTAVGKEHHGIESFMLMTQSSVCAQGFGGWDLRYEDYGIAMLFKVMWAVGAKNWEDLKGMYCRVDEIGGKLRGIGHITDDEKWYYPEGGKS